MTFWGRTGFIYSFMIQNYILMERWNFFTKCVLFQLQNSHRIELKYWTNKIFFERKWLHTKIHKLASWCKMHLVQFHIKLTSCIPIQSEISNVTKNCMRCILILSSSFRRFYLFVPYFELILNGFIAENGIVKNHSNIISCSM